MSKEGIEVDNAKVELISNLPTPKCVKDIQSFLGHARFYRRFIKKFKCHSSSLVQFACQGCDFCMVTSM